MSDKEFEPISKILEKFSQEGHENTITFEDQKLIHKIRVYIKTDKKNFEYFCKKLKEIYTQDEFPVNSIIPSLINDFTRFTKKEEKDEIIEWFREFLWELLINNNEYLKIFGLIIIRYNRIFILGNKVKFYRKIIGLWDSDDEDLKSIAIWSLIPYIPFDYNYFLDLFEKLYEFIINSENELLITKSLEFLGNLNLDAMRGGEKTPLDLTKAENIMEKIQNVKNPYIKTEFVDGFSNLILEFNQYLPKWINLLIKVYEETENINLKSRIMRSFSSIANKKDFTMKDSKKIEVFFKTRLEILLDQNFELPEDSIVVRPNILQDTLANIQQLSFFLPLVAENLLPLYLQVFHKYIPELVDNRPGFKGMAWQWLHGFYINMINYYKSENNYEKLTLHFKQAAEFAFSEKEKLDLLISSIKHEIGLTISNKDITIVKKLFDKLNGLFKEYQINFNELHSCQPNWAIIDDLIRLQSCSIEDFSRESEILNEHLSKYQKKIPENLLNIVDELNAIKKASIKFELSENFAECQLLMSNLLNQIIKVTNEIVTNESPLIKIVLGEMTTNQKSRVDEISSRKGILFLRKKRVIEGYSEVIDGDYEIWTEIIDFLNKIDLNAIFPDGLPYEKDINIKIHEELSKKFDNVILHDPLTRGSHVDLSIESVAIEVKKLESFTAKDELVGQVSEDLRIAGYYYGIQFGIDISVRKDLTILNNLIKGPNRNIVFVIKPYNIN